MPFQPPRFPTVRSGRNSGPLFSVGRRVFVNCPGERSRRVPLTDDAGNSALTLPDGAEVEILAWRPRGSGSTRYRVHSTDGGAEGWLAADNLRASPAPAAPVASLATPPAGPEPAAPAPEPRRRAGR